MDEQKWQSRPAISAAVTGAVFLTPVLVSILASAIVSRALPRASTTFSHVLWWIAVLTIAAVTFAISERGARRFLPLASLLKMTLVFPDRAPRRLVVARKVGSTRSLQRRMDELKAGGDADFGRAAEQILALAAALNAHDRLTRGHSERVRTLTDLIADEMKLPADDRERLRWSALLHDVGKLTVHADILNKPGKPTPEEWETLKAHPVEGAKIAAPLAGWLGPWANSILEHHEKFDGKGYPGGLAGEQISLGGRIVAVADCYECMTAVRSYKKAMSAHDSRTELASCAGTHFDPNVVRAMLDASVGNLRAVFGPVAVLADIPLVNQLPRLGARAATAGRAALLTVAVAGGVGVGLGPALTTAGSGPPAIHTVAFTRPGGIPTVTITGSGLGRQPSADPPYTPEGHPLCPLPPSGVQGFDYGTSLYLADTTGAVLAAGRYRPGLGELDCIGLLVTTFSPTKVVFHVGSGYSHYLGTFAAGDQYEVAVNGIVYRGQIHFESQ